MTLVLRYVSLSPEFPENWRFNSSIDTPQGFASGLLITVVPRSSWGTKLENRLIWCRSCSGHLLPAPSPLYLLPRFPRTPLSLFSTAKPPASHTSRLSVGSHSPSDMLCPCKTLHHPVLPWRTSFPLPYHSAQDCPSPTTQSRHQTHLTSFLTIRPSSVGSGHVMPTSAAVLRPVASASVSTTGLVHTVVSGLLLVHLPDSLSPSCVGLS